MSSTEVAVALKILPSLSFDIGGFIENNASALVTVETNPPEILPFAKDSQLCLVQNASKEYYFPLVEGRTFTMGRKGCDLTLLHPSTSLVHFRIWYTAFNADCPPLVYVQDVSKKGVFVNKKLLGRKNTLLLENNDVILVEYGIACSVRIYQTGTANVPFKLPKTVPQGWRISDRVLGYGSFGIVLAAKKPFQNKPFAVKVIKKSRKDIHYSSSKTEGSILLQIEHVSDNLFCCKLFTNVAAQYHKDVRVLCCRWALVHLRRAGLWRRSFCLFDKRPIPLFYS